VRQAGFELVRGGYAVAEVDEYLDALEERVLVAQGRLAGRRGRSDPAGETEFLKAELTSPYMKRFARASFLRRGYHVDDVDEFVDRVVGALDGTDTVSVEEVRQVPFRPRRGGYREDAVDDAMDRVVEYLLLVRREGAADAEQEARPAD
jgi:DivIVA domain-containing protein